jgi:ABC-2 type transport system permease protein/oleandomycin transport system permease protein
MVRGVQAGGLRQEIADGLVMTWRNLKRVPRIPELWIFAILQSIMFVLLFAYVFGGAIPLPGGGSYTDYLMPGIFAQTIVFASATTAITLTYDLSKGIIDRLRSLPMAHSAVLIGRTVSDLVRNVLSFVIMFVVAVLVGFRIEGSLLEAAYATLLLLFFSYAFSWIQALIGLSVGSVEAANSAGFIWMFPLTFVSSAFVDTANMPSWLEGIADANPFTKATNATRALYNGLDPGADLWWALAWAVGITLVFSALSIRKFNSSAGR